MKEEEGGMAYGDAFGCAVHVSCWASVETGVDGGLGWVDGDGRACDRGYGCWRAGCLGGCESQSGEGEEDRDGGEMHFGSVIRRVLISTVVAETHKRERQTWTAVITTVI